MLRPGSIPALLLCFAALAVPGYPQEAPKRPPPERLVLLDALQAADLQTRLNLIHVEFRAGRFTPEAVKTEEKETAETIARLRGGWVNTPYLETFDSTFKGAVKNPGPRMPSRGQPTLTPRPAPRQLEPSQS